MTDRNTPDDEPEYASAPPPPPERTWDDLLDGRLLPGDVLADKYRLDELIGYGAMGFVIQAWHLQLEEKVAVKFLLPELGEHEEALMRFEREARAAFKIRSEHVARVLDVGRVEDTPFMVMEFLEGENLGHRLDRGPLPVPDAVDVLLQACQAVDEAHELGIVHRDLKPDNLFLVERRDGTSMVKVLDFGLSKVLPRASQLPAKRERALTADTQVMGTAQYMSPEQWVAAKRVDRPADVWALGVIFYEMVTGRCPFARPNIAAMANAVLRFEPPPLSDEVAGLPASLDAVVRRCLEKKEADRFASVRDLMEAMRPHAPRHMTIPPPSPVGTEMSDTEPAPTSNAPPPRDSSEVSFSGAGLPRLGIVGADGIRRTWGEVQEAHVEAESDRGGWIAAAAIVVVTLVLVALWVLG